MASRRNMTTQQHRDTATSFPTFQMLGTTRSLVDCIRPSRRHDARKTQGLLVYDCLPQIKVKRSDQSEQLTIYYND
jgi:hypothetical protein